MKLYLYRTERNYHGTQQRGEFSNGQTVTGPKLRFLKLRRDTPGVSWRVIFYRPSGACIFLDILSKLRSPS
jgi:hypothetical protein